MDKDTMQRLVAECFDGISADSVLCFVKVELGNIEQLARFRHDARDRPGLYLIIDENTNAGLWPIQKPDWLDSWDIPAGSIIGDGVKRVYGGLSFGNLYERAQTHFTDAAWRMVGEFYAPRATSTVYYLVLTGCDKKRVGLAERALIHVVTERFCGNTHRICNRAKLLPPETGQLSLF